MSVKLAGARVTVVGLGLSGLAAARLLVSKGAQVTINDARDEAALGERAKEAAKLGVQLDLGGHDATRLSQNDFIVVSPGVPPLEALASAEARGVRIYSEVELASWFVKGTVVGITGTNGKSTVTTLVGEMCKATGRPTFVGGNLGTPLVDVVGSEAAQENGYLVVELSSFQLERIERFRAHVGVILNVTDDHLDRYAGFADYAAAKGRLFATQLKADHAVAPSGDSLCVSLAAVSPGTHHLFAGQDGSVRVEDGTLRDHVSGLSLPVSEIGIQGAHNLDNACAAALAARLAGVEPATIARVLREFKGLAHRMQHVAQLSGVTYFDDSKATNVGASVAAIVGLGRQQIKVVLIAGGKDKGGSYAPLREVMEAHGAGVVLIGEASNLIADAFEGVPMPVVRAGSMGDAVRKARDLAKPGDAVLLAPACASFDMFRSYAHRGDVFKEEVLTLGAEAKP
ncbi:MAG: UDP-N-acetylmuramoyl-L-alanine--D-glutamate ligase [Myxococcales bacterium]